MVWDTRLELATSRPPGVRATTALIPEIGLCSIIRTGPVRTPVLGTRSKPQLRAPSASGQAYSPKNS